LRSNILVNMAAYTNKNGVLVIAESCIWCDEDIPVGSDYNVQCRGDLICGECLDYSKCDGCNRYKKDGKLTDTENGTIFICDTCNQPVICPNCAEEVTTSQTMCLNAGETYHKSCYSRMSQTPSKPPPTTDEMVAKISELVERSKMLDAWIVRMLHRTDLSAELRAEIETLKK
jgi:hypothetical protein